METRELYKQKMAAQIKVWSTKLDALNAKAEKASADAKIELQAKADELEELRASAQAQMDELSANASDTWDTVKADISERWDKLSGQAEALWEKLR